MLAVDDTRSQGPSARNWADLEIDTQYLRGPDDQGVVAFNEQLAGGLPRLGDRDAADILAPYQLYQVRFRSMTLRGPDGWMQGPLTLGAQRFFPIDHVSFLPLAYAHLGVEASVATPWLSGRGEVPPVALRTVYGVDSELAGNGWSVRPASAYLRLDFLACRAFFGEVGAAPELFVTGAAPDEYDARLRLAFGWSFGCAGRAAQYRPKISVEYKARVRLHAGDAATAYWDSLGAGLQMDVGGLVAQLLVSASPTDHMTEFWMIGLRLQLGPVNGDPR